VERETGFVGPGTKARIEFGYRLETARSEPAQHRPAPRGSRDGGDAGA